MNDLKILKRRFDDELTATSSAKSVEVLRVNYLGKSGLIPEEMKKISEVPSDKRKEFGAAINTLKAAIENDITAAKLKFEKADLEKRLASEAIDITVPAREYGFGKVHPLSQVIAELKRIFFAMGFKLAEGPDIEDDWHNFTGLNMPKTHPARQAHDTFYLEQENLLLRTHTSSVQIRYMENNKPPFRIITLGNCYRSDFDATHTPMFHQIEALYIDKGVNIGHLKGCIEFFLKNFFNLDVVPMRLRSSYFPFTEPSIEVDIKCDRSDKKQIKIGEGDDWLEIFGAGMVHPKVLKNVGVDPNEYQGFALGAGIERLAMLKYNIPDLRSFFAGDIRWHKHYGF
jgi:phenylalanyl-tRNA synthetase alpha chain